LDNQQIPDHDPAVTPPPPPAPPDEPIDDAQLSPRAWVVRHGPTLLLVLAGMVAIYYKLGLEGMWSIAKVALGLGAVIFVHELGHFLVAKWCDVHVQTFSIGFGPALPGCLYKWGETTYKVALFPLGGYVKMVGEGGENDEEDTDPRSFKNKTVGQRMAIISAGVVMNVIFGLIVFIIAFKIGVHQTAPVVGTEEAGSPAWQKGVRPGDEIVEVDGVKHPSFDDLRGEVMTSSEGKSINFAFRRGQEDFAVAIVPRKNKNEKKPVIGINPPLQLRLPDKDEVEPNGAPTLRNSASAAARTLDLKPDDRLLAATDPEKPDALKDLPEGTKGYADLGERLYQLADKTVQVKVRRATGGEETLTLEPSSGFQFSDTIVGTSDPESDNPFKTLDLEKDPRDPQGKNLDYFQFLRRLSQMTDRPVVLQVHRKGSAPDSKVNIFVPVAYHRIIPGVRMEMGAVTAVREKSSAEAHGVKEQDVLIGVTLSDGRDSVTFSATPSGGEKQLDPLRLPYDLRRWARGRSPVTASLKVRRVNGHDADATEELSGLEWKNDWTDIAVIPLPGVASLAISELGLAYQVKSQVAAVEPGAPAAQQGLQAEDFVLSWSYQRPPKNPGESEKWMDKPINLRSDDNPKTDPEPRWAFVFFSMQELEYPRVRLQVRHKNGEEATVEVDLKRAYDPASPEKSWPLLDPDRPRGLLLGHYQDRIVHADGLGNAIQMGLRYTSRTIVTIYMALKALLERRISAVDNLQGPIDIARMAYHQAGSGWADFLMLLGLISVNLAVVNFLPIPILDGGHMVFLIYEKLRGRPASEHVRLAANWVGLLILASLMIFVIGLGIWRLIPS
jgi:regulator of sigma E protease